MIPQIKEINLPSYATLCKATAEYKDMAEKTITSQVSIDGQIRPDFSFDWEVHHMGEKFIMPLRTPQASKENTSWSSKIDLTFQHWAIYQLKRWYFFTLQSYEAGVAVADQYIASVSLNLKDFCELYARLLKHYFGDKITIDLNPDWEYAEDPIYIDINYSYMWDVLIELYKLFAVRWEIQPNGDPDHYVIKVGYTVKEMNHIFEYGFEGGLMKLERQVQDDNIRNMLLGRGGDKNIPYLYFKKADPNNPTFQQDPDWIPELANVYFDRLRSAEFRSYVQGWKARHYYNESLLPNFGQTVTINDTAVPWAYYKGYNDEKFDPVEFVADKIAQSPFDENTKEVAISPTYNAPVVIGSSIDKYGPLLGSLDNNDEIYPSIQGVILPNLGRIDQVVDVEQVTNNSLDEQKQNEVDAWKESLPDFSKSITIEPLEKKKIKITSPQWTFKVPNGYVANLDTSSYKHKTSMFLVTRNNKSKSGVPEDLSQYLVVDAENCVAINSIGEEVGASGIPEGSYQLAFYFDIENTDGTHKPNNDQFISANISISDISIQYGLAVDNQKNQSTFDIWIKNIWQTAPNVGESAEAYAERVWKPILGNHLGDEAAVCFSSGLLSTSEDYTFLILGKAIKNGIHYDTSKSLNGVQSHWRLTLVRSTADYDSLGKLVPNLERQGKAGDYFYFTGIELTHYYVKWAEQRLHDYKLDKLSKVSDIQPAWVVSLDKVRIGTPHYDDTTALIEQLHIGGSVRIADKRFIGDSEQLYLYLQQITYKYNESQNTANLTPDVEVVLGTDYQTTANPVAQIQSQIDAIHNQIGGFSTSNIQQIVRMVGDRIYLRKDGLTDRSQSITYFAQLLAALGFRQGMVGGYGWGIYQDENGKWVIETDRVNVRDEIQVNSLVINQIQARGGMIIESLASIEVSNVEDTTQGYKVYFDTKHGSLGNLFKIDDVAYCHRYTSENQDLKYYKRKVIEVGEDYIVLSKSIADGQGIPAEGDVIVHFGNYTDKERQYVIVRDMMGGGYERMLSGLNSVMAEGNEYYFAGYQSATGERFFIGTRKDNQYIEYVNGKLYIPGQLILGSETSDGKTMLDYIKENGGLSQEEIEKIAQEQAKAEAEKAQKAAKDYADAIEKSAKDYADAMGEDLQKQIDGAIETWFYPDIPTLDNEPAVNWKTNEQKNVHLGDLYYDQNTGKCYRFQKESDTYIWKEITDTDIQAALEAANQAQDTADGKRRVFLEQPTPPYDEGDLWVNATYGNQYKNDILRCKANIHKDKGETFAISDWGLASDYTNDDTANKALNEIAGYEYLKKALTNGRTEIEGGLMLTSLIELGLWQSNKLTVYSGISGIYTKPSDIAAWYGGDMWDKENDFVASEVRRYAQSLFRFDGSGYLAGGNITWDNLGNGSVGKDAKGNPVIKWDSTGVTLSDTIKLGTSSETLSGILAFMSKINNMFTLEENSDGKKVIRANYDGFYSLGFVSTKGMNSGGGSSGGGASYLYNLLDVDQNSVIKPASGQVLKFNGSKWTAGEAGLNTTELASYLSTNNYAKTSDIPSLAGYATQQWVKDQKYLTEHQSLANYVTLNTAQTISGRKLFSTPFAIKMQRDTSNAVAFNWRNADDTETVASVTYHNTNQRLYLNPQGSEDVWMDEAGKYSLRIGVDSLTYNTYPILRSDNFATYLDGSYVKKSGDTMTGTLSISPADALKLANANTNYFGFGSILTIYFGTERPANTVAPEVMLRLRGEDKIIDSGGDNKVSFGDNGRRWSNIYSVLGNYSGLITATGGVTIPSTAKLTIGSCEITWDGTGLRFSKGIYSDSFVSVLGVNSGGGSGGGSMYGLVTASWVSAKDNTSDALGANLGYELYNMITGGGGVNSRLSSLESGSALSVSTTGSGNAVTSVTKSGNTITVTKGTTFLTSHQSLADYMKTVTANATFVTSLGVSGNDLTWTKNGTTNSITVPFATQTLRFQRVVGVTTDNAGKVDADTDIPGGGMIYNYHDFGGNCILNAPRSMRFGQILQLSSGSNSQLSGQLAWSIDHTDIKSNITRELYWRAFNAATMGGWGDWKTIAFTDSNVASADKLSDNTAYTAWGQTFFTGGKPKSISGALTNVGSIYGADGRCYIWTNDETTCFGDINPAAHPILIRGTEILIQSGIGQYDLRIVDHNVGIGIQSPSYKLHVIGTSYFSQLLSAPNGIKIGDCEIKWTSNGLQFSKGIYSQEFVSALGANAEGGSTSGGVTYLYNLKDIEQSSVQSPSSKKALVYDTSKKLWIAGDASLNTTELSSYLATNNYAKKSDITWSNLTGKPTWIGASKPSYSWSEINDKPTWIGANKPAYSFGEITGKPTTLSGYGITDAYTKDETTSTFVKKSGDTMTGNLTVPRVYVPGSANSSAFIGADGVKNLWVNIDNRYILVANANENAVRSGSAEAGNISLGTSSVRWSNLYSVLGNFSDTVSINRDSAGVHLGFGRASYNYIAATSAGGIISFTTNGLDPKMAANATLHLNGKNGYPGSNLGGSWGTSTYAWSSVYTNYLRSNTTLYIESATSTTSIIFRLGTKEYMRLAQPNGYVGIRKTAPQHELDIAGTIRVESTDVSGSMIHLFNTTPAVYGYIGLADRNSKYGLRLNCVYQGSSSFVFVEGDLDVSKTIHATAGIYTEGYVSAMGQNSSSDARLKGDLKPISLSLAQIANAPSVFFRWKKDGSESFGSIAQYWHTLNPLFSRKDIEDHLTLDYGKLALTSVIAVAKEVMSDKERIKQLESRVAELEKGGR